jgi:hypothetical protein
MDAKALGPPSLRWRACADSIRKPFAKHCGFSRDRAYWRPRHARDKPQSTILRPCQRGDRCVAECVSKLCDLLHSFRSGVSETNTGRAHETNTGHAYETDEAKGIPLKGIPGRGDPPNSGSIEAEKIEEWNIPQWHFSIFSKVLQIPSGYCQDLL